MEGDGIIVTFCPTGQSQRLIVTPAYIGTPHTPHTSASVSAGVDVECEAEVDGVSVSVVTASGSELLTGVVEGVRASVGAYALSFTAGLTVAAVQVRFWGGTAHQFWLAHFMFFYLMGPIVQSNLAAALPPIPRTIPPRAVLIQTWARQYPAVICPG